MLAWGKDGYIGTTHHSGSLPWRCRPSVWRLATAASWVTAVSWQRQPQWSPELMRHWQGLHPTTGNWQLPWLPPTAAWRLWSRCVTPSPCRHESRQTAVRHGALTRSNVRIRAKRPRLVVLCVWEMAHPDVAQHPGHVISTTICLWIRGSGSVDGFQGGALLGLHAHLVVCEFSVHFLQLGTGLQQRPHSSGGRGGRGWL